MAKRVQEPEEHEHIQRPASQLSQPNCIRCSGTQITHMSQSYAGQPGVLIYCEECGGIITWAPRLAERG
jgi:hypothetical protein